MRGMNVPNASLPGEGPLDVLGGFFLRLLMHIPEREDASMEQKNGSAFRIAPDIFSYFDGFPYVWTRMSPGFFHLTLLPRCESPNLLLAIAGSQAFLNQLLTGLALAPEYGYYWTGDGPGKECGKPPSGGVITFGQMKPFRDFPVTADLARRMESLANFGKEGEGCVFGDITKGAHRASDEELQRLAGRQENGVPLGLARCSACGEWKGECLDPNPKFQSDVLTVHCLCDNKNLCASCGRLLNRHKLNANYFCQADGRIWHVPGFSAFGHRCGKGLQ
jgi:hypothetical protein